MSSAENGRLVVGSHDFRDFLDALASSSWLRDEDEALVKAYLAAWDAAPADPTEVLAVALVGHSPAALVPSWDGLSERDRSRYRVEAAIYLAALGVPDASQRRSGGDA